MQQAHLRLVLGDPGGHLDARHLVGQTFGHAQVEEGHPVVPVVLLLDGAAFWVAASEERAPLAGAKQRLEELAVGADADGIAGAGRIGLAGAARAVNGMGCLPVGQGADGEAQGVDELTVIRAADVAGDGEGSLLRQRLHLIEGLDDAVLQQ